MGNEKIAESENPLDRAKKLGLELGQKVTVQHSGSSPEGVIVGFRFGDVNSLWVEIENKDDNGNFYRFEASAVEVFADVQNRKSKARTKQIDDLSK